MGFAPTVISFWEKTKVKEDAEAREAAALADRGVGGKQRFERL
jgi:hypothetical protein